jgi:uncharacterized hydrophobic protein (TIGR00341 family)
MSGLRIIEVITPARHIKELIGMAKFYGANDYWLGAEVPADQRQSLRILISDSAQQPLLDAMQSLLDKEATARIVVCTANATLPRIQKGNGEQENTPAKKTVNSREELYTEIAKGARLDNNFLFLVVLSTIVATIGLAENNVAVIIGAMVIAPLLGPIIAFAFATSLGDKALSKQGFITSSVGLGLAFLLSLLFSWVWPMDLTGHEIQARTDVGLDGVALALASGAAAVLSLTTGLSSALVGVMVAVALLPPTAVFGLMIGSAQWYHAAGAALLLIVNIVCVLLSAKIVFLWQGVKPRDWFASTRAQQSLRFYILLWSALLLILIATMSLRHYWYLATLH